MSAALIAGMPYAGLLGVRIGEDADGAPVVSIAYSPDLGGNPGTYHGGVFAGLADIAVALALRSIPGGAMAPVSTTIDYRRVAVERPLHAVARIVKAGRRLNSLSVTIWQDDAAKPVATGTVIAAPVPIA